MAYPILILGESGTGKSASMRNLDPGNTLLIQTIRKPLPFRSKRWKEMNKEGGNIAVTDNWQRIIKAIHTLPSMSKEILVIDDFQYLLANEFMRRCSEKSFDKFTEIGHHCWSILMASQAANHNGRIYFLMHTNIDDKGITRAKTIGKLIDEKITFEGLFSIVLRTNVSDGEYSFTTRNNGSDTVKSPIGLFDKDLIENDINQIDKNIKEYYEL